MTQEKQNKTGQKTQNFNPKNERIKSKYLKVVSEEFSPSTINTIRKAILRYDEFTNFEDFKKFNGNKAVAFKKHLSKTKSQVNAGQLLAKSTIMHTINPLKDFFMWLAVQDGYKSKIKAADIKCLSLSANDVREAQAVSHKDFPTIEQIRKAVFNIKLINEINRRNQALMAFTLLTGARDGAIISLKLKHIDIDKKLVIQNPKEVKTKFRKYIETFFFPVGDDIEQIVIDWVKYLKEVKFFDGNCSLFPKTAVAIDEDNSFINAGISKEHWQTATPLREIFKATFADADLKYYNPHSFRNTLVQLGEKICTTPEEFKAWSQNLGHESPLTTFISYGQVSTFRQGDIIKGLGNKKNNDDDKIAKILSLLEQKKRDNE